MSSRICLSSFDRRVLVISCTVCCVDLEEFIFALLILVAINLIFLDIKWIYTF